MGEWMDKIKDKNIVLDSNNQSFTTSNIDRNYFPTSLSDANYPTLLNICVGDGVEVSGAQPDTSTKKRANSAPDTVNSSDLEVSVVLPDTSRVPTRTTAAVCFELLESPPTRTEAVERLVVTFRPEIHEEQRQRWLTTTLSGKPVSDAPESYLLAETVGLTAWAQDREDRGVFNRGAYEWITAAWQAVERRAHHLKVA